MSFIFIMLEKRFTTDRERLRMARRMDLDNLTDSMVAKSKIEDEEKRES